MSATETVSMTLAKATPEDFRIMWKITQYHQNLQWAEGPRVQRLQTLIILRLEQLGAGGFLRIVMGCETLIGNVCDPKLDYYAFKPVYGAAPELLDACKRLEARGFFNPVTCADAATLADMQRMREAILNSAGGGI